jgi:hypothetical protein
MTSQRLSAADEVISPEVCLVDPEFAERARALLPDRPWYEVARETPEPEPQPTLVEEPEVPYRRRTLTVTIRVPVTATLVILTLAAVLASLAFGLVPASEERPTLAPAPTLVQTVAPERPLNSTLDGRPATRDAPGFGRGRIFELPTYEGASYYRVVLSRNGKRIYTAFSNAPKVRLPADLRLRPGTYVWTVSAGFGPREAKNVGRPYMRSKFEVDQD